MKTANDLTKQSKQLRQDILQSIQDNITRIQNLLKAEDPDAETNGQICLPEGVFIEAVDEQQSLYVMRINTNTKVIGIDDGIDGYTENTEWLDDEKLIMVLKELESIKTFNEVELI